MSMIFTLPEPTNSNGMFKPIQYKLGGTNGDCWECFSHCKGKGGYPVVCRNGGRVILSRYVYVLFTGNKIEPGNVMRHKCDNPACINPAHLEQGTQADNVRDMVERKRYAKSYPSFTGSKHHNSKLNERLVWEIKHLIAYTTMPQHEIGKLYGFSQHKISVIKREKDWKHVKLDNKY